MVGSTSAFAKEEIQQAIVGLPKRQREALDLRELEGLSYTEIAARMGTSDGSVAQLIARARINLYDELRGTPLASIAAPSRECERSLPLIAAREDRQLDPADGEAVWLDAHLAGCDRCRPAVEQMAESAAAYRVRTAVGTPDSKTTSPPVSGAPGTRRRTGGLVLTFLAGVLLVALAAALLRDDGAPAPGDPATEVAAPGTSGGEGSRRAKLADPDGRKGEARKKNSKPAGGKVNAAAGQSASGDAPVGAPTPTSVIDPVPPAAGGGAPSEDASGPNRSSGKTAVNPPRQVSTSEPSSTPKPVPSSTQASPPASEPAPEVPSSVASPPAEEVPEAPGRSGEAPGKPADRPQR